MDHDGLQNFLQIKRRVHSLNCVAERADFVQRLLERLRPLRHLLLKSRMRFLKTRRHPVEIFGQFLKFVAGVQMQSGVKIARFKRAAPRRRDLDGFHHTPSEPHGRAHRQETHGEQYAGGTAERDERRSISLRQRPFDENGPSDVLNALV